MRRWARALAVGLLLTTAATACTLEPSQDEELEDAYLAQVRNAVSPLRARAEDYVRVFRETEDRERFEAELKKIRAYRSVERVRIRVRRLTPPPRYSADHARLLRTLQEMQPVSSLAGILANESNLVPAAVRHAQFVATYDRALTEYSGRFCLVAAHTGGEADLCDPLGILPGGVYGDRLHASLARLASIFAPKAFLFVSPVFTNDEVAQYLRRVQPDIVDALTTTRREIRRLVPPDEFVQDQQVIETYFGDFLELSQAISAAAQSNPPRLRTLFPRSQRIVNEAREKLSDDIRASVDVWFEPSTDEVPRA
jgi:hypothetical protein